MTCRDFIEFLWRYLSGELPADQRAEFEQHLGICPDCVAYLHSYKQTVLMGREAFEDLDAQVPTDVPEELVWAILASRDREI